jgi:poly-gamma-glutamate capsule biosynthesis protein CapA/YwtB (metallophosphatase superfamily)
MGRVYYSNRVGTRLLLSCAAAVALLIVACGGSADDAASKLQPLVNPTDSPVPTLMPAPSYSAPVPPLTTADVFPPRDLSQYNLDPSHIRTVIATGDVIPARHTDYIIRNMGNNFEYAVDATKDITSAADITVINLEAPLIDGCPEEAGETFTFCGQPGFTVALQDAGVDIATLENNHIGNYASDGITETEQHLDAVGIKWADRSTPAIVTVRGLKFGFLAFNDVGESVNRAAMKAQIEALRPQVDVLSVAFHWGMEYVPVPQPAPGIADDDPVELAHAAIDDGADLIIGNHPHWIQGVEVYKGKFITYAHGNFIFDQEWSYETTVGVIGKYTFYDNALIGVDFTPVLIQNYAQPVPMIGDQRQQTLDIMKQDTAEVAAKVASGAY